jgi:hypothetical protein
MTADTLFSLASMTALGGWLVLAAGIVLKRPLLRDAIAGTAFPLLLAAGYTALILVFWWSAEGGFDTLANVQKLFTSPWVALAGWVHYLAYDLFIGALLARRMMEAGLSRLLLVPVLPLAFLFGPIGFLAAQSLLLVQRKVEA